MPDIYLYGSAGLDNTPRSISPSLSPRLMLLIISFYPPTWGLITVVVPLFIFWGLLLTFIPDYLITFHQFCFITLQNFDTFVWLSYFFSYCRVFGIFSFEVLAFSITDCHHSLLLLLLFFCSLLSDFWILSAYLLSVFVTVYSSQWLFVFN